MADAGGLDFHHDFAGLRAFELHRHDFERLARRHRHCRTHVHCRFSIPGAAFQGRPLHSCLSCTECNAACNDIGGRFRYGTWPAGKSFVNSSPSDLALRAAPLVFVFLWSTGFVVTKLGMPYAEPLTFLMWRMVFVVAILAAIVAVARPRWPNRAQAAHSAATGILIHGLYLGGVFVAISQGVPAGISALIPGLQPILTSTIAGRFLGEKVTPLQWSGLVLGLIGVLLVLHDRTLLGAGHDLRMDFIFRFPARDHARHALSEALRRPDRLAQRKLVPVRCRVSCCLPRGPSHSKRAMSTGAANSFYRCSGWSWCCRSSRSR